MNRILITGGFGYIGSHLLFALLNKDQDVYVIDNYINSYPGIRRTIESMTGKRIHYSEIDVTDDRMLNRLFEDRSFDAVIHLASLKSVEESMQDPGEYYRNNVVGTINIINNCIKHGVKRLIFSSSATVYGNQQPPFTEDMEVRESTNPYGQTKIISERILKDIARVNKDMRITSLRYFNPIGNIEGLRENPKGEARNIIPILNRVANGSLKEFVIYGHDYNTKDGTAERDYIHIMDLVNAHIEALHYTQEGFNVFNIGTGQGVSVKDLIRAYETANDIHIPYRIEGRRPGDTEICYSNTDKVRRELGWKPAYSLEDMVRIR